MKKYILIITTLALCMLMITGCSKKNEPEEQVIPTEAPIIAETTEEPTPEPMNNNQSIYDIGTPSDEITPVEEEEEDVELTKQQMLEQLMGGSSGGSLPEIPSNDINLSIPDNNVDLTIPSNDTTVQVTDNDNSVTVPTVKPTATPTQKPVSSSNPTPKPNKAPVNNVTSTPTQAPAPKGNYATVTVDGKDISVAIKVKEVYRGDEAIELLEYSEDGNGAAFGTITNEGYEIVIITFTVTMPDRFVDYTDDCIPDTRVRNADGSLINNEAVYTYVTELEEYNNTGKVKTYDIVFEIPKNLDKYMIQFGNYGSTNYNWMSK